MNYINLIILGAGGTGGHLFDRVARLAYGMNADPNRPDLHLTLIDGDDVEDKNLLRQNFILDDLGENKAEALAYRYKDQMDVSTKVITEFFTTPDEITALFDPEADFNVIVGAVDNHYARYLIEQSMAVNKDEFNAVWVDSGNGERFGQVIVSGSEKVLQLDKIRSFIPDAPSPKSPFELYPESFMDFSGTNGDVTQLSCELAAISAPQNIATNIIAGDVTFMILNKLFAGEILTCYEYKFDTQDLGVAGVLHP